jgi:hypothetical protein
VGRFTVNTLNSDGIGLDLESVDGKRLDKQNKTAELRAGELT